MNYNIIVVTIFSQNCLLVWCKQTNLSALVDPGGDIEKIKKEISSTNIKLTKILLTHGHIDHVGVAKDLAMYYSIPIFGPKKEDEFLLKNLPIQGKIFGLNYCQSFIPDNWLNEGDKINIGNLVFRVLHCPGHTPGHIVFFEKKYRLLISGDVIFNGSIGRTDFSYSNTSTLIDSINEKLFPLGDDVTFIPGHGSVSTLGNERLKNYFLKK